VLKEGCSVVEVGAEHTNNVYLFVLLVYL